MTKEELEKALYHKKVYLPKDKMVGVVVQVNEAGSSIITGPLPGQSMTVQREEYEIRDYVDNVQVIDTDKQPVEDSHFVYATFNVFEHEDKLQESMNVELEDALKNESMVYDKKLKRMVIVDEVGGHWNAVLYFLTHAFNLRDTLSISDFYDSTTWEVYPKGLDVDEIDKYIEENIVMKGQDPWTQNRSLIMSEQTKEYRDTYKEKENVQ